MARISKGILGPVSGTVGTIVGGTWRGVDYIRGKSGRRSGTATEGQQIQRTKFKMLMSFLMSLGELTVFSFPDFAINQTGRNYALSYNMANAFLGQHPNLQLNYPALHVSRGSKLPNIQVASARAGVPSTISFQWTDNSGAGRAKSDDKAVVIAHCPSLLQSVYSVTVDKRSAGSSELDVPAFAGRAVHTWLFFIAPNQRDVATSVYTGMVTVL